MSKVFLHKEFRALIYNIDEFDVNHTYDIYHIPPILKDYFNYYKNFNILYSDYKTEIEFTIGRKNLFGYNTAVQLYKPKGKKVSKYLIYCHGYFDHSGIYGPLISLLNKNDIGIILYDMPGHGLTPGKMAEINDFGEYVRVLEGLISYSYEQLAKNDNNIEFYLMGYSTGAAVVMEYLMHHDKLIKKNVINKTVLCSPLVRVAAYNIRKFIINLLNNITYLKRNFDHNTHNVKFSHFIKYNDPLQGKYIPISWIKAMSNWNERFTYYGVNDKVQMGIMQGTKDIVVDWKYNINQIMRKFPNCRLQYIEEAYHNLLNEDKEYLSIVQNWLIGFLKD